MRTTNIDRQLPCELRERVPLRSRADKICQLECVAVPVAKVDPVPPEESKVEVGVVSNGCRSVHETLQLIGHHRERGSQIDLVLCDAGEVSNELRQIPSWIDESLELVDCSLAVESYGSDLDDGISS